MPPVCGRPEGLPCRIGQFITDAMDSEQVPGFNAVIAQFFSQLNNYLVQSSGGAVVFVSPDFIEKAVAGKYLVGMVDEDLKEFDLASGK